MFVKENNKVLYQKHEKGISVCNLNKTYLRPNGENVVVFDNFNISFDYGKISCLMGPSGCGKSTLVNIISGFEHCDSGNIYYQGREMIGSNDIGIIFQNNVLFPWKTIIQNLSFVLRMNGTSGKEAVEIASDYLNQINMIDIKDFYPYELSGGMQQKIALLRILLYNPKVVIMDEAFGALDSITRWKMQDFFLSIYNKHRFTTIIITHDIDEAIRLSDSIYILSKTSKKCNHIISNDIPQYTEKNNKFYSLQKYISECLINVD